MDDLEVLRRFGLPPRQEALPTIRRLLAEQIAIYRQGDDGDTELMRALCVMLFAHGDLDDVLLLWKAKRCGFDPASALDIQFLCGAGWEETLAFLQNHGDASAAEARLELLARAEDFEGFTPAEYLGFYREHYYAEVFAPLDEHHG